VAAQGDERGGIVLGCDRCGNWLVVTLGKRNITLSVKSAHGD
jgi:hypothetical protein